MSVTLMGQVWALDLTHQEQAVLMALADHANEIPDKPFWGDRIFPSIARIAWKTGYSVRAVQYAMSRLRDKQLIIPVAHEKGGRGRATEYVMRLDNGPKKAPYEPEKGAIYDISDDTERVQSTTSDEKGAIYDTKGCKVEHKRVQSTTERVQPVAPQPSITINNHNSNHHAHAYVREEVQQKKESEMPEAEPEADTPRRPMAFPAFKVAYCEQEGYTPGQVKTSKLMPLYNQYRATFDAGHDEEGASSD